MAYLTRPQYVARFGQEELTELLASGSALTFAAAADDASAIIDSYIASAPSLSEALPFATVPARIVEVAAEITRYKLWGAKASEQVTTRYEKAIEYLEMVASGELAVPGSALSAVAGPAYTAKDRVFTDDNLTGFL